MEIKATLSKPYTDEQRADFIVEQNYNSGYEIRETETALEAWGYTEDERLISVKQNKYQEANEKATSYLESGEALYEFEHEGEIYHVEATDGNISKIGLKATALILAQDFETKFPWNTKEDINIFLNGLEGKDIAEGLGSVQDAVWVIKYPAYLQEIREAQTVEEVKAIVIDYSVEINL